MAQGDEKRIRRRNQELKDQLDALKAEYDTERKLHGETFRQLKELSVKGGEVLRDNRELREIIKKCEGIEGEPFNEADCLRHLADLLKIPRTPVEGLAFMKENEITFIKKRIVSVRAS